GTVTQVEGRVIRINRAVTPPEGVRTDWQIVQDIAKAMGRSHGLEFNNPKEIFEELRLASKGGVNDYSGITWERVEKEYGVFWPCYDDSHPGTKRLFEKDSWNPVANGNGRFFFPDGKARFNPTPYLQPAE